eukprot:6197055-Pleurochrysis_carterae.AAC.2
MRLCCNELAQDQLSAAASQLHGWEHLLDVQFEPCLNHAKSELRCGPQPTLLHDARIAMRLLFKRPPRRALAQACGVALDEEAHLRGGRLELLTDGLDGPILDGADHRLGLDGQHVPDEMSARTRDALARLRGQ